MRKYILILLFGLSINLIAKDIPTKFRKIETELSKLQSINDSLENKLKEHGRLIDFNKKLVDSQLNLIGNSNDSISNQISTSSYFISTAGLVLGFLALFIGAYVTWMQSRSSKILKKSKEIQDEVNKTKSEIEKNQDLIERNFKGLFYKIQEQQVEYILGRIEKIPEDMQHVFPILASMEIPHKFFDKIKPIVINEKRKQKPHIPLTHGLITLSCQHFPDLVVKDKEMLNLVLDNEDNLFINFYDIEIDEFISFFIKQVQNDGIYQSTENIAKFLILINSREPISKFTKTIFNSLESKLNRFEFGRIAKDLQNIENFKTEFFKQLTSNYINDSNSENDNLLLTEIQE
mgnify:CR=1 FL=1